MQFKVSENEISFIGPCPIDEAEALHDALRDIEHPVFDLSEAGHLHTAIVQLIMASAGLVRGVPADPVLTACLRGMAPA